MAKAPAKPEAENGDAAAPAPKRGKKLIIILLVVVILLLVIAGGVVYLLMSKKQPDEHATEAATPKVVVDPSKPPTFVPLETFTVNLQRGEGDHYLQTVIVLKVSEPKIAEDLKVFMPEIRHRINLLLSSRLPSEIANIEGREILAEDIMIEANDVLGFEPPRRRSERKATEEPWGPVLAVLFNSFIVQ